jgi:hypothetical protein
VKEAGRDGSCCARVRGLTLGWTGLMMVLTLVSTATTMLIALSLAYARLVGDF